LKLQNKLILQQARTLQKQIEEALSTAQEQTKINELQKLLAELTFINESTNGLTNIGVTGA